MKLSIQCRIAKYCTCLAILAPIDASAQSGDDRNKAAAIAEPLRGGADASGTVAKLVHAGIDLSWLFEPVLAKHVAATPDDAAKAGRLDDLARVAAARGLDRRPDVRDALRAADTLVLAEAARRSLIDSVVVPDSEVAARIARQPGRYDEYRLSHIFVAVGATADGKVRSEAEALAIAHRLRARIMAGESFAAVAASQSEDRETAEDGGMLSTLLGVTMNPAFLPFVVKLPPLGISEPVRGPQGYHLIRLEDRRRADVSTARFWVEQDVIGERLPKLIADAVASASSSTARPAAR